MKKLFLFFVCVMAASWMFSAQAKSYRVNNAAGVAADYKTLDAAMATSGGIAAGDTIYLEGSPDAYSLSAAISKKVTIIGPGYFLTANPNTLENKTQATITGNVYIAPTAAGSVFEGILFYTSYPTGYLYIGANNVTVRRCNLQYIRFNDNNTTTKADISSCVITQCYINNDLAGTSGSSSGSDRCLGAQITNNIFADNAYNVISYVYNTLIEHNTFGYTGTYSSCINNTDGCTIQNNIINYHTTTYNTNAKYEGNKAAGASDYASSGATSDGKWKLTEVAMGTLLGTDNKQIGAYGGVTPYVLSGLPDIPHVYTIDAPTAASSASGLKVTIKVGTEK